MKTEAEKRFVEFTLEFERDMKLQLAFISYDLDSKKEPIDYFYDISNELLISLNNQIEIKNAN